MVLAVLQQTCNVPTDDDLNELGLFSPSSRVQGSQFKEMARKKAFIDRKKAQTFQLVHRSQRDPLVHDEEASQRVLVPLESKGDRKPEPSDGEDKNLLTREDLAKKYDSQVRPNEGEAAEHGIFYDDTEYDYMQHLRQVGNMGAVLLETQEAKQRGKQRAESIEIKLPPEVLPSDRESMRNYQDQQNVQDAISGFQPDMDPRIREVLEALEADNDEALVSQEFADSGDFFGELTRSGIADDVGDGYDNVDGDEGEEGDDGWGDEEDGRGWSSDDRKRGAKGGDHSNGWEQEFARFKSLGRREIARDGSVASLVTATTVQTKGRNMARRRNGAESVGTGFSMSSSAMNRNAGLTLLDDRFDIIERQYDIEEEEEEEEEEEDDDDDDNDDDDNKGLRAQTETKDVRPDFEDIMDDFLNNFEVVGSKMRSKTKDSTPLSQLDDVRRALRDV